MQWNVEGDVQVQQGAVGCSGDTDSMQWGCSEGVVGCSRVQHGALGCSRGYNGGAVEVRWLQWGAVGCSGSYSEGAVGGIVGCNGVQ